MHPRSPPRPRGRPPCDAWPQRIIVAARTRPWYPAGVRIAIALAVVVLGACKGDPAQCELACRNYAKLSYWKDHDAEIAAAPAARREAMKHDALAKFSNGLESG